jgi:hypothetical protein
MHRWARVPVAGRSPGCRVDGPPWRLAREPALQDGTGSPAGRRALRPGDRRTVRHGDAVGRAGIFSEWYRLLRGCSRRGRRRLSGCLVPPVLGTAELLGVPSGQAPRAAPGLFPAELLVRGRIATRPGLVAHGGQFGDGEQCQLPHTRILPESGCNHRPVHPRITSNGARSCRATEVERLTSVGVAPCLMSMSSIGRSTEVSGWWWHECGSPGPA